MQWVVDVQRTAQGWSVTLRDLTTRAPAVIPNTTQPILEAPREIRALACRASVFPIPPPGEPTGPDADLAALCDGNHPELTATYFSEVVTQSISLARMKTFGRYLFLTLLGQTLWDQLATLAAADGVELILSWLAEEVVLTRLPWEMMHGTNDFLVAEKRFSLAREIAKAKGALRPMSTPPRVLVVIGSGGGDRHFDGLKPGTEYFGLLRGLRQNGIGLNLTPLVGATPDRLKDAVKRLRPDVVHFICHGRQNGTIDLVDNDNPDARKDCDALSIYDFLTSSADEHYPGPQIVVLNACYSASAGGSVMEGSGQVNSPLAAALVSMGIPVVVGMAGEVADQACRLFSRSFYQSLLTDGLVLCAAAKGRRAGLVYGNNDRERIDWALPTLFISQGSAGARIPVAPDPNETHWHQLAESLAPARFPGYYPRLELLRAFGTLMLDGADQVKIGNRRTDLQVLGLSTDAKDGAKLGRSSALKDLAAAAARNGDLPIVVDKNLSGPYPLTAVELMGFIANGAQATVEGLELPDVTPPLAWRATRLIRSTAIGSRPPAGTPPEVADLFITGTPQEYFAMLAAAARLDMLAYLDEIRTLRQRPRAKLLLLIDDVHKMGDAVPFLLDYLLNTGGLRAPAARSSIRVLFTYSRRMSQDEQTVAITRITDFLSAKPFADDHPLAEFRDPTESRLAYENYLFNWRKGDTSISLVPVRANTPGVNYVFEQLCSTVRGIPSLLAAKDTIQLVDIILGLPPSMVTLRVATDEDALRTVV